MGTLLRIEAYTLRVAGVKTLALEPSKPLIQPVVSTHEVGDLINRLLQALAYILKLTTGIPRSNVKVGDVGFKGLELLTGFLNTGIEAGIVEIDFLVQPFY